MKTSTPSRASHPAPQALAPTQPLDNAPADNPTANPTASPAPGLAPARTQVEASVPTALPTTAEPAPGREQAQSPAAAAPTRGIASVSSAEATSLSLPPPQRAAIEMLTSGHSLIDSATAAGVNRTTLYRWLKTDPHFQAAYNAWQHDAIATARGKLIALTDAAMTAVSRALHDGDAKTALVVLKSTGILDRPKPGSTDPDDIRKCQELEKAKTTLEMYQEYEKSDFGG